MGSVLVIENNIDMKNTVANILGSKEIRHISVRDEQQALSQIDNCDLNLVIIDIDVLGNNLPEFLEQIRNIVNIPILVIVNQIDDRLLGTCWRLGANDYIHKPLTHNGLIRKVKSLIYPCFWLIPECENTFLSQGLKIDIAGNIYINEKQVYLSGTEYRILMYLINNKNTFIHGKTLYSYIWDSDSTYDTNIVRVNIKRLRKKLNHDGNSPSFIISKSGLGYCFLCKQTIVNSGYKHYSMHTV